jgi:hypothetical protein
MRLIELKAHTPSISINTNYLEELIIHEDIRCRQIENAFSQPSLLEFHKALGWRG